jgi:predicted nicotinamide N-methyase
MSEAKTSTHVKSSIVLTDEEEVSFASVFADMFEGDHSGSVRPSAAESASRADHRGATSVEFCFGSIRMPMHANSDEVTKLQGHISALVWRSSLLASSIICGCTSIPKLDNTGNREIFSKIFGNSDSVQRRLQGCDVLELGCGRALVGKVCSKLGASSVVLTDCDDRALKRLKLEFEGKDTGSGGKECPCEMYHLLWEREQCDADLAALASIPGSYSSVPPQQLPIRHWADAYRLADDFPYLNPSAQFDFVIASDCLYFHVQEEPLAAALHRRLKKPDGIGMILVETRGNGAFQLGRFLQLLQRKGFGTVLSDSGPWDFDVLVQEHIRRVSLDEDAPCVATTGHEQNGPHVILVSWR